MVLYEEIPKKAKVARIVSVDGFETFEGVKVTLDDGTKAHERLTIGDVKVGNYWVVCEDGFTFSITPEKLEKGWRKIPDAG